MTEATGATLQALNDARRELDACRALLAAAWVGVPMRWRKISAGALILVDPGKGGAVWIVATINHPEGLSKRDVEVALCRPGAARLYFRTVHPDDQVNVLMPVGDRDALKLVRGELGGEIIGPGEAQQ